MRSPGSFALLQATQTEHFGILLGVELIGEMHRMERGPMTRCRGLFGTTGLFALLFTWGAAPLPAQAPRPVHFLATHYDVSAALDTIGQSLSATAKIDFKAGEASSNVSVELHPNLVIKEVKGPEGKPLSFERDKQNPLFVNVQLLTPIATGGTVTLTFNYAGLLFNEESSPVTGVRVASINKDGAYLLLPARWFPLTDYPSDRYTATFRLNVPANFAVAGSGKAAAPTPLPEKNAVEGPRVLYTFECNRPAQHGTFVAGNLQLNPKQAEGVSVNVYAPRNMSANAQDFASDVARAVVTFSDMFGPIPDPSFTLIQMPEGTLREFAAPGVLLLSQRIWDPKASDRAIARLVASQWFGVQVAPATPNDVWISDGLARYCEALYAEQNSGKEAGLHAVDEFAVGALMYEDAAPVGQAGRLAPYSPDYRSVVMNKGAMLFHMLRAMMGDGAFKTTLRDFYFRFAEKSARNEDFENLAERQIQVAAKARGEDLAEQGKFYDAVVQYQKALSTQPGRPLANFRMGEAFFYQKNYTAAGNSFRECLQNVPEPSEKWTEVWSHIYLGEIFDILGQRERAVNEYSKAKQTNDNTGGAQARAEAFLKKPYSEGGGELIATPASAEPAKPSTALPTPGSGEKPVLKKRPDPSPNSP